MKASDYPIIYSNVDDSCEYLSWESKDIFIVGKPNKSYNGDVLALIDDCVLDDIIESVKPLKDEIVLKNNEYMNWYNSYDLKKASLNLQYYKVIDGYTTTNAYDDLKNFIYEKFGFMIRSYNGSESLVKKYIEKNISSNTINSNKIYALNGKPFLIINCTYDSRLNTYTILDQDVFMSFYTSTSFLSISDKAPWIIDGSEEIQKCPIYLEDVNFENGEIKYVYIKGEFVPYIDGEHSIDEPKFKKMGE